ncbi:class I SAM-dependent methyltransferase [Lentzea tibetensis]|uniref:Class I SAM-dependent methyltransferase n=1 Tax=Lentzea tibetensis TaxID=2591470 RepID=A0A563EWJ3_9PSEU|nr:class I SAM-dependent methyltransferase [Lentzea tibetensis]TWP51851.1 class I SAM-dependent methyltransferase [Lentzea tibetensis]
MSTEITAHYADGVERTRLTRSPHGRLEFLRTQEILRRTLPKNAKVLDVGGAMGVHAEWLAQDGHRVHLIDPVPDHVEAAAQLPGVTAAIGDARQLDTEDNSVDVVLLFGPLYHLTDPRDRQTAIGEAKRVLRTGGQVFAAGISRYLTLMELGTNGGITQINESDVDEVVRTGRYNEHAGFVETHFHTADELAQELGGFSDITVFGVEGPAWPTLDATNNDEHIDGAIRAARLVETDPHLIHASAHLLARARLT